MTLAWADGNRCGQVRSIGGGGYGVFPLIPADERLSTAAMERELIALDTSRAKRAGKIDEMAATYILQGAIDRLRRLTAGASDSR